MNQIAQRIIQHSQHVSVRPDDVVNLVNTFANNAHISDWLLGGKARKDFVKDVAVALKGKVSWASSTTGKQAAQKALKHLVAMLTQDYEDELGNIFPDGDPHDAMSSTLDKAVRSEQRRPQQWAMQYMGTDKLNLEDLKRILTGTSYHMDMNDFMWHTVAPQISSMFTRKNKGKDVYDYMANIWDEYAADRQADAKSQGKNAYDAFAQSEWANPNPYRRR